jgi:glycosyltransferase involved in cell wall biosynthesis
VQVLRVYHGGRDGAHRQRERALVEAGVKVTLVVPDVWPGTEDDPSGAEDGFELLELPVRRVGDVNRHAYDSAAVRRSIDKCPPDLLDIHEEPFSIAARQWLRAAPPALPVVMYTAQNIDKRLPPPFFGYERRAYGRVAAFYPCSRQAASVTRGKGFTGEIEVIPLGYDDSRYRAGAQSIDDAEIVLGLFGRLVPEKGVREAVRVLAAVVRERRARLLLVGTGPEKQPALELAQSLGVADRLDVFGQRSGAELADLYRRTHVALIPSRVTETWAEQFGRAIVEAQASGAVVAGYSGGAIAEVAGDAGVLAPEAEVEGLAAAVIRVLGNPDEHGRLRAAGLRLAESRTWSEVGRRQAALYRRALAGEFDRVSLPSSPSARRVAARREFGPTAPTRAGDRPFALPWLRRGGPVADALANSIDAAVEMKARRRA